MHKSDSMAKIKILPEQLINKIAAGEVVERPASIVKELIENSIDAGADQILITIKNGGKDFISILDNGSGMDEQNARLAIERHATSKIYAEEDLEQIQTLGFRGEALASIASVSHLELLTCHDEQEGATSLSIKGGCLEKISKTGFPKGTKITIQNLFFNTPARLKFMKTTSTEFRHIQETVVHQALARPHIQFRLTHNQQLVFSFSKGQSLEQRIYQLFGEPFQDTLTAAHHQETYLHYEGFISLPTGSKSSKRWQYLFVNDRFVKCPAVNHAVYDAYRTLLMKNQHPAFFLKIFLDPSEIDVNVHPAKTEIRFRNSQLIHTILVDQLNKTLMGASHQRHFGSQLPSSVSQKKVSVFPVQRPLLQEQLEIPIEQGAFSDTQKIFSLNSIDPPAVHKVLPQPKKTGKPPVEHKGTELDPVAKEIKSFKSSHQSEENQKSLVLGQLNHQYIVVEKQEGLALIDQHAASECILLETYQKAIYAGNISVKSFSVPILLELSPQNAILLEQYLQSFNKMGFQIEPFGKTTYSIHAIPSMLSENKCKKAILSIVDELMLFRKNRRPEEVHKNIQEKVACCSAIQAGDKLCIEELEKLVIQLERSRLAGISPHGKPVLIEVSYQELEKRFKRSG
ncbi:MAG: DNA mismatch repair endonuclease MutL [SAR324 cluster bacterium]|nr:DNA mismatch repair endonuclease MutL [SAR324 cluster bacterium]